MESVRKKIQKLSQSEKRLALCVVILAIISFAFLICLLVNNSGSPVCYTPDCVNAAHYILHTVDQTVHPCQDFYKFVCGNFLKEAIAKDQVSPLKILDDMKERGLKQIVIEKLESENNLTRSFRNQRMFYRACMNTTAIEEDKDKTFLEALKEVTAGWPLSQGYTEDLYWPEVMVKARKQGLKFDFFLDVDMLHAHSESSVYLEVGPPPIKNFDEHLWKEANLQKIMEMAEYWGDTNLSGTWELRKTIEFAKNLKEIVKKAHRDNDNKTLVEQKTTISKLKNLSFLKLDWLKFLKNLTNLENLKENDVIVLRASDLYLKDLYYLLQATQTKFWANYIVLLIIADEHRFLSKKIEDISKEILTPSKYDSRREYCFHMSTVAFERVAEAQYIRKVVTEEKREHIKEIIKNVKWELQNSLKTYKWMDKETKQLAAENLQNVTELLGWADIVFNETEFEKACGFDKLIFNSNNVFKLNQQLSKFYFDFRFSKIGADQSDYLDRLFRSPVLEVNAAYIKNLEIFVLMAPILQPPVYDENWPEYMNYGSLGRIIGHELTHALSKVEEDWELFGIHAVDYWSNGTHRNYEKEAECINEEYENYTRELNDNFPKATKTLSENVADFGGLNLAYRAYQKWVDYHGSEAQLPGLKYSPNQLFWIMASSYMCKEPNLQDSERETPMGYGQHAVSSFRVIGPIRNSPYFGNDFGCPEGSRMNPKNKCRLLLDSHFSKLHETIILPPISQIRQPPTCSACACDGIHLGIISGKYFKLDMKPPTCSACADDVLFGALITPVDVRPLFLPGQTDKSDYLAFYTKFN